MSVGISIVVSLLLIIANGYFSMSEMALVNASKPLLDHAAEEGDEKAAQVVELQGDSSRFLATIQVVITLMGFFASAAASTNLSDPLASLISGLGVGWLSAIAPVLSPILITLIVSYFSIVIGELVPKRMALSDPEGKAKSVAPVINAFQTIMKPLVWLTSASADGLSKLLRIKQADESVSEDELKYMVSEQEDLSDDEKQMIPDVFDLGDTIAREVMVPRVDVEAVEDTEDILSVLRLMNKTGFSRMPVYHGDIDDVIGIVNIKDLIKPALQARSGAAVETLAGEVADGSLAAGNDASSAHASAAETTAPSVPAGTVPPVGDYIRKALFVPDTKDLVPLLSEMKTSHMQMAVVVDEYGGTAGVVTIEDIVEEIVGEIEDEYDPDNRDISKVGEGEWVVEGTYPIDDAVELGWPIEDSDEYETIAGWLMDELDKIAEKGDVCQVDGWTFRVTKMDGRRIERVYVKAPSTPAEGQATSGGAVAGGSNGAGETGAVGGSGGAGDASRDERTPRGDGRAEGRLDAPRTPMR